VICAEPSKEVHERLAVHLESKVFFKAHLKLSNVQEAVAVIIDIADRLPDCGHESWLGHCQIC